MRKFRNRDISENLENLASAASKQNFRSSISMEDRVQEYHFIKASNIVPYKRQARKHFNTEDLEHLADTIREYGVRQPLTVIKTDEVGKYEVISGERRLRAARLAELEKVPCIILNDVQNTDAVALIENIQRSDLHPLEYADALTWLIKERGDITSTAKKLGLSTSQVSELIKYSKIPTEIKDHLISNQIKTRDKLRKLSSLPDVESMNKYLGIIEGKPKSKRKKQIFSFHITDGKIQKNISSLKLTDKQRTDLMNELESLLNSLRLQKEGF